MNCCTPEQQAKDDFFTSRSRRYSKRLRKKGLDAAQKFLFEGISETINTRDNSPAESVMEIGCGVGGLLLAVLQKGLKKAVGVDASSGMIDFARENAAAKKLESQTRFFHGDFSAVENEIECMDIVILDKVLCCDANPDLLIKNSARKAAKVYAVSYPRDNFLIRYLVKAGIAVAKILPMKFTPFYHEPSDLRRFINEQHFSLAFSRNTIIWQVEVYRKN